jgi:hypothetical protein
MIYCASPLINPLLILHFEWKGTIVIRWLPWRWRRYVPSKLQFTQDLHGATSQKMAFFKSHYITYQNKNQATSVNKVNWMVSIQFAVRVFPLTITSGPYPAFFPLVNRSCFCRASFKMLSFRAVNGWIIINYYLYWGEVNVLSTQHFISK